MTPIFACDTRYHRRVFGRGVVVIATLACGCGFRIDGGVSTRDAAGSDAIDLDATIDSMPDDGMIEPPPDMMPDMMIDAPLAVCEPTACGAAGGTCTNGACLIVENGQTGVTCPAGMPCSVQCNQNDACKNGGVDCGGATTCEVSCFGTATCQSGGVDCGLATLCTVRCIGSASCQNGTSGDRSVECRSSTCEVTCNGSSACQNGIDVDTTGDCTSHCCGASACMNGLDPSCDNDAVCI